MHVDWEMVVDAGESNPDTIEYLTIYGITVTSIHDVDVEEFSSALDAIHVGSGGTGTCQVLAFYWPDSTGWSDLTMVDLLAANRDCCVAAHQMMVGVEDPESFDEHTIDRSIFFGERDWWGVAPAGEFVFATGGYEPWQFFDVQYLLHLSTMSTALHIRTWAMPNRKGALDDWSVLIDTISEFSVELIEPTVTKYLTAQLLFPVLDSP